MFRGRFSIALFLCVFAVCGRSGLGAAPAEDLLFKVAVYGPSDELYIWWGHAALIVENTRWGYSRVFDWGIFSYPSDNFLEDFLKNQVRYRCAVETLNIAMYVEEDRDITVYTLDLDAEKKEAILAYAENNVLPEHCYYDYHEFRDNCATRIRDIIDMGTGGQLKEFFAATPGRLSRRQHIQRFTWFRPFSGWFLDFLMGQDLDEPMSVWEEMFLPVEIGRAITDFRYRDSAGGERKLVRSVELLNTTKNRPPILNAPLRRWPGNLTLSVLAALACLGLKALRTKRPLLGRILWGAINGIAGLSGGAAGCVLVYGRFFMPHDYIQQNSNILFMNPLLLAAVPLGVCAAANKAARLRPERNLRLLWTGVFLAALLALLIRLLPPFFQQNQPVVALVLPVAFVLSGISDRLPFFDTSRGQQTQV